MRYRRLVTAGVAAVGAVLAWRDAAPRHAGVRTVRPPERRPTPQPISAHGTVLLPFGRYFAGRADMLTQDGFKTIVPIDGISPFTAQAEPDPGMAKFVEGERVNDRVRADVRKDLASRLAESGADYLVVDNTAALLLHREVNGRLYVVLPDEDTDLMDMLGDEAHRHGFRISRTGFTADLRAAYDGFVSACLAAFDPSRIILVRSHAARFWVADDGTIAPTNLNRADARLLDDLDDYFAEQTGCLVSTAALGHFPKAEKWQTFDHELRTMLEADLLRLCAPDNPVDPRTVDGVVSGPPTEPATRPKTSAADHVVGAFRRGHNINENAVRHAFEAGGASYDDLLSLAFLEQWRPGKHDALIRECVKYAVTDEASPPLAATKRRFDTSLGALRAWEWCAPRIPADDLWAAQATVTCGRVVFRFRGDGSIETLLTTRIQPQDAAAVVDGTTPITPLNLTDAIGSWPVYFERGRRGITTAVPVTVPDTATLIDTCYWIDWEWVLDNEHVTITTPNDPPPTPDDTPQARTDLSFIFDPNARICTVGGGLMDQITHIALFDELCTPHGLDYYLDDFRYTWARSHNGFEASRLAPHLENRRMTRLVSQALIETFRREATKTAMPWTYHHARAWHAFGLTDAMVVTADHIHARRLLETDPPFPVLVYAENERLRELIHAPPAPVGLFTTTQRIRLAAESADAIRRVFDYRHLEAAGIDPDVARMADVLRAEPHVAFHVRRGDYLTLSHHLGEWHSRQDLYVDAITFLIESEFGTSDFNVAVFSDDMEFVEANAPEYGLDRVTGDVRFIRGNTHYTSIFDSYLMSLCPVIVGSVGAFAATTSLLAEPPSVFIRARPEGVSVEWRR